MKALDLSTATSIYGDPQAVDRGYISEEVVADAIALAEAVMTLETFGQTGYLMQVGCPEVWWEQNCPTYLALREKYASQNPLGFPGRSMVAIEECAEWLVADERRALVESRYGALEIMRKSSGLNHEESEEYRALGEWLKFPTKAKGLS